MDCSIPLLRECICKYIQAHNFSIHPSNVLWENVYDIRPIALPSYTDYLRLTEFIYGLERHRLLNEIYQTIANSYQVLSCSTRKDQRRSLCKLCFGSQYCYKGGAHLFVKGTGGLIPLQDWNDNVTCVCVELGVDVAVHALEPMRKVLYLCK